jgi:hypothetical protein
MGYMKSFREIYSLLPRWNESTDEP